jgi:hypothetical protein
MNINQTILEQILKNIKEALKWRKINGKSIDDSIAFLIYSMMTVLWLDIYEAIESITEWSDDNNIDWFYIDQTNDNIIVSIFQSKHRINLNSAIGKNDVDALVNSLQGIFWWNILTRTNVKLLNKIKDLQNIISENWLSKKPIVNIYFVTNWNLPNKWDIEKADLLKEEKNNFEFKYYNLENLLEIDSFQNKKDYNVRIFSHWKIVKHSLWKIKSIIAMISAENIIKLIKNEEKIRYLIKI